MTDIQNLELRRKALFLWETHAELNDQVLDQEEKVEGEHSDAMSEDDLEKLIARRDEAWNAYADDTIPMLLTTDDQDEVIRCAKCGEPLIETDEFLIDDETGEWFLRSALGLPPRAAVGHASSPSTEEATV